MRPKTALLLYELEWMLSQLARPTLRSLTESFEGWAYRNGHLRHIQRLEAEEFIATQGKSLSRVVLLTEKGHQLVKGPRDPEQRWGAKWDGLWRLVVFDVPELDKETRNRLRRRLKALHFGQLQRSVWISHAPIGDMEKLLRKRESGPCSLTLLESRVICGSDAGEIVRVAWDFDRINGGYTRHMKFLDEWRRASAKGSVEQRLAKEKALWDAAIAEDPLLPSRLLPSGYLGRKAFMKRRDTIPRLLKRGS